MAREAPVGNVALVPEGMKPCLGQRTLLIRPNPRKVNPAYLAYLLVSPAVQGTIHALTNGVTVPHLNMKDVRALALPQLPALVEQGRIASVLAAYDELIENCQRRIRILEDMARGLYREWFVHFRFPGAESLPRVDSPLGPTPEGWNVRKLSELAEYISRGIAPRYDAAGPSLVINQKCIREQRLSLDPARPQARPIPIDKRVRRGDVLINSTGVGTLGRVAQVLEDQGACTVDTHVTIARPAEDVDLHFFGMSLLSRQEDFERLGVGATGQTELSRSSIGELQLVVPEPEAQRVFGKAVAPIREQCVGLGRKISNLRRTRDLLLPRLLSGQTTLAAAESDWPSPCTVGRPALA